jgi:hypothetical protein
MKLYQIIGTVILLVVSYFGHEFILAQMSYIPSFGKFEVQEVNLTDECKIKIKWDTQEALSGSEENSAVTYVHSLN